MIMLPPLAIVSFLWLRRVRPIYRSTQADRTNIDGRVNETFGGIRVVRAFRRENREEKGTPSGTTRSSASGCSPSGSSCTSRRSGAC